MVIPGATRMTVLVWILVLVAGGGGVPVPAETRVQTEIESMASLIWTGDELGLSGISRGTVDFRSAPAQHVQARLQMRLTALETDPDVGAENVQLQVPRANIRFRFPLTQEYTMRVTAGRDRLTWGVGSLFNAADLLFGADGSGAADLTRSDEVRDETAWLLALYFPLGALGYLEAVTLPHPAAGADSPVPGTTAAHRSRAGLRVHSSSGPVALEVAYLYDGAESSDTHTGAIALQGNPGIDLYGAARYSFPDGSMPDGETIADNVTLSLGAFHMLSAGYDHTVSLRLEALVRPGGAWGDRRDPDTVYGVQLYPELVWSAGRTVQIIGRAIVSPLDTSADLTTGISWNIFQGFYALAFFSAQAGRDTAVYGWDRPGSAAIATGFRYLF